MSASIIVDLGDMSEHKQGSALFREAGALNAAISGMRDSMRAFGGMVQKAAAGLSRMGDYARGIVSALMHAQNLAQGLDAGLRNLYRWGRERWKSFATTLDSLAASALYLKNSFAAMAAPLIQSVAPAINYVTNRLVDLFNLAGQLMARLSGSDTYVAARRTGEAWDAVGGRIGRAASALRRYVAGFDQLNVLQSDAASGGGGGGGGAAGMFETRTIESGLRDFADRLREAFQAGDWAGLGALLGEKINGLVESVDWAGLGAKVGWYVNGLFSTVYWTLDAVNFENIGAAAAVFLNDALAKIDFTTAGGTVALLFTSFWETVAGFITGFDWAAFAGNVADGVNGFAATLGEKLGAIDWPGLALRLTEGLNALIAQTDWALLGATLGGRVSDLLAVLGTAAASFDWAGAGAALAASVNGLFHSVNWDALGDWLNNTLLGVLDFGLSFFNDFDAAGFADGIGRALSRVDWDAVAQKLWALFKAALKKLGEFVGTLLFGGSADLSLNLRLLKDGWTTIAKWLGIDNPLAALLGLKKDGWTSIAAFVGTAVTVLTSLVKGNSGAQTAQEVYSVEDRRVTGRTQLAKGNSGAQTAQDVYSLADRSVTGRAQLAKGNSGAQSVSEVYSSSEKAVSGKVSLEKNGWTSIAAFVGTAVTTVVNLSNSGSNWVSGLAQWITGNRNGTVSITTNLVAGAVTGFAQSIKKVFFGATGGVVTANGVRAFASGGMLTGSGRPRWWDSVRKYATGTSRAHGTLFAAGEAGPEIVGHINGRTEILNKSQLAQTMYSAVASGMLYALSKVRLNLPAVATGVVPYEVAARIAQAGEAIEATLNANNEDLIQTIISVIGAQTSAIVAALQQLQRGGDAPGGMSLRQIIEGLNRQTQMYGTSPLIQ